ncbi:MAG: LemA family protein [Pseudomonas sp.]
MQGMMMAAVAALLLVLTTGIIWGYNRLVFNRVRVAAAWSDIDVQLKRRSSLIPPLVDCVKTYMAFERDTLLTLSAQRQQAQQAETAAAPERSVVESQLSASLKQVLARAEAYPDLKANSVFLDLQHALSDVENQIQMARRYYNGAVRELNVLVESVPTNLLAKAFGFSGAAYFALDDSSQAQPPKMEF